MNIDTSVISGFDSMTADQKVEALLGLNLPDMPDMSQYVAKSVFDKKASEAAELSKQLKGKMSDEELAKAEQERLKAEQDQKYADLENKYNEMARKNTIAEYTAKYLALGYDEKLAKETAEAMADGKMDVVFQNSEKHKTALEAKIKAELMKGGKKPNGAGGDDDDGNNAALERAKNIGKAKAEANKATADVLKYYT